MSVDITKNQIYNETKKQKGGISLSESAFGTVLLYVILFCALMLPGYILAKTEKFTESAVPTISNILINIAMPTLVFTKIASIDITSVNPYYVAISAILPVVLEYAVYGISLILCKSEKNVCILKASSLCAVFSNCGFLGIPLAAAIWSDMPQIVLYISVFNCVSTFQLLTLGKYILIGDIRCICAKRILTTPVLLSIIAGLTLSVANITSKIDIVLTYSGYLASLATPLSMLILGYELSKIKLTKVIKSTSLVKSVFLKLVVSPAIAMLLVLGAHFLGIKISQDICYAMLISSAVSTAASAPSMCALYGADSEFAAGITVSTTLFSVISLPVMYLIIESILKLI